MRTCNLARYIPLNYLIHYFGVVVVLLDPPPKPVVAVNAQIINALSMFIFYLLVTNARETYGCDIEEGLIPTVALVVAAACYFMSDTLQMLCVKDIISY